MTRVLARRTLSGLVPADDQAAAEFKRVPPDKVVYVELVTARNPKQHRLLFALLNMMVTHGEFPSTEAALIALKFATGYVDSFKVDKTGETFMVPKSISYANMRGTEFSAWFDSAIKVVAERWLPGVKSETLRAELEEMVGA